MMRAIPLPMGRDLQGWLLTCLLGTLYAAFQVMMLAVWPEARGPVARTPLIAIWSVLVFFLAIVVPCVCIQRLARRHHRWLQVAARLRWPGVQPALARRSSFALVLAVAFSVAPHLLSGMLWSGTPPKLPQIVVMLGLLLALYGLLLARWPAMGLLANLMLFAILFPLLSAMSLPLFEHVPVAGQWTLVAGFASVCWMLLRWPLRVENRTSPKGRWRAWFSAPLLLPRWRQERALLPIGLVAASALLLSEAIALHLRQPALLNWGMFGVGQLQCVLLLSLLLSSHGPSWRQQLHPDKQRRQQWLMPQLTARLLLGLLAALPLALLIKARVLSAAFQAPQFAFSMSQAASLILHLITLVAAALLWRGIARQRLRWDLLLLMLSMAIAMVPISLPSTWKLNSDGSRDVPWWLAQLPLEPFRSPWLWLVLATLLLLLAQQVWARQSLHWLTHGLRRNAH